LIRTENCRPIILTLNKIFFSKSHFYPEISMPGLIVNNDIHKNQLIIKKYIDKKSKSRHLIIS
jgi:hypothetical protein